MAGTTETKKKKKITDLFFKVEEIPDAATASAPVPETAGLPAQEDAEIKEQLSAALSSANQPGYDYFEFAQAAESMISLIPAEALRYQSTFASAKVQGVTAEKLLSSAQYYLNVLKKKETEFDQALEDHTQQAVTAKMDAISKVNADMLAKAEQIRKINEEINTLQTQKTAMTNEVSDSQTKIAQTRNNFGATMKLFVDRISSDMEKIKTYLK